MGPSTKGAEGHQSSWHLSYSSLLDYFNEALLGSSVIIRGARKLILPSSSGICHGTGKTVLVTTGRQAKTLHTVHALKAVGCRVVVTDYSRVSTSAVSVDCDAFEVLPPLATTPPHKWIEYLRTIIERHNVDLVVPVSTINEVLPMALAKDTLSRHLPHVQWICPGLDDALALDDRALFAEVCDQYGVPAPTSGVLTSREDVQDIADRFEDGVIFKRIESSVNRAEEVVIVPASEIVPKCVSPTKNDPWQWQQFISGTEMSVWYIAIEGKVTFSACYYSEADLTHFDPVDVPYQVDTSIRRVIAGRRLTGQYAFDFIVDKNGDPFVLECNPRSSSILETVSTTPDWGDAFFGTDVTSRTVRRSVGFVYHRNCWPWSNRTDGHWTLRDPLPALCAQIVWPMHAVVRRGLSGQSYKVDVNICKVIVQGPSPARNIELYRSELMRQLVKHSELLVKSADTLILDISVPHVSKIAKNARTHGTKVVQLCYGSENSIADESVVKISDDEISNEMFANFIEGETRALLGPILSRKCGSTSPISYRIVTRNGTLSATSELPLRRKRILHLVGSCSSDFYAGVSELYAFGCIAALNMTEKYEHLIAYVHKTGEWSFGASHHDPEYFRKNAERMCIGDALARIDRLSIDVVQPQMFDLLGMTTYRALFDVLGLPLIGCDAYAMALSANKVHTKAIAECAGVAVAEDEVLSKGMMPKMEPPYVLKPVEEDNSLGLHLVQSENEISPAIAEAFNEADTVMCERFIELGRELRVAVLENANGEMEVLPVVEYFLPKTDPIRSIKDKLATTNEGIPNGLPEKKSKLPADIDDKLGAALKNMAIRAHKALRCRDYSIFDVRVDPEGNPIMLESCLYCSFSPSSVIVTMAEAKGLCLEKLFDRAIDWALARRRINTRKETGNENGISNLLN